MVCTARFEFRDETSALRGDDGTPAIPDEAGRDIDGSALCPAGIQSGHQLQHGRGRFAGAAGWDRLGHGVPMALGAKGGQPE